MDPPLKRSLGEYVGHSGCVPSVSLFWNILLETSTRSAWRPRAPRLGHLTYHTQILCQMDHGLTARHSACMVRRLKIMAITGCTRLARSGNTGSLVCFVSFGISVLAFVWDISSCLRPRPALADWHPRAPPSRAFVAYGRTLPDGSDMI